ncbi:MobC family plasmid mobilization relaxosome protein [Streptococcus oralis]|uniref:MobC family plasmid mobilization relaxosome protein n=1 Tax=Streptococcus oralis TaxID=1303 RepID=UPI0034A5AEFC
MEHRYRTNLKKVFLTDSELNQLNNHLSKSRCKTFSEYARKVLLNPNMNFLTIDTITYQDLIFELKRIGNNVNQIAHAVNQNHIISHEQFQELRQGMAELVSEVEKDFQIKVEKLKVFYGSH